MSEHKDSFGSISFLFSVYLINFHITYVASHSYIRNVAALRRNAQEGIKTRMGGNAGITMISLASAEKAKVKNTEQSAGKMRLLSTSDAPRVSPSHIQESLQKNQDWLS